MAAGAPPTAGSGRLLILDDDELVGLLVATVGRLAGMATRLTTGHAAFFQALDDWQPSHLVIDLTLPGLSGEQVLQQLAACGCQVPIIVASGADGQRLAEAIAQGQAAGLQLLGGLSKPFSPAALRRLLGLAGG